MGRGGGVRAAVRRIRGRGIEIKTPGELEAMRAAGAVVAKTLRALEQAVRPGVTTLELDQIAEQSIRGAGATPSFLGYHGFPASICASVNEEIVHGIPTRDRLLREGDLISIDCGAILDGWHGDAAVTVSVGEALKDDAKLSAACRDALLAGIASVQEGNRLSDVSHAVESAVLASREADGIEYGIIADYGGHGIGTSMHMDPFVPNVGEPGQGPRLVCGMALAIEPMLTLGSSGSSTELQDGWTVVTDDGTRAAHWEHSVAVTPDGPVILTE